MSTPIGNFFSERLRTLRGDRNKAEFSRFLGLSAPVYQRYEGGRVPRSDILSVIAGRCGVTADWLLGIERLPRETTTPKDDAPPAPPPARIRESPAEPYSTPAHTLTNSHTPYPLPLSIDERLARLEAMLEQILAALNAKGAKGGPAPGAGAARAKGRKGPA